MILQALAGYYDRLAARTEPPVPRYGYSDEKISFALVIAPDGTLVDVMDLRDPCGRKLQPRVLSVPRAIKRTSGIASNFLWDKTAYVLGSARDKKEKSTLCEAPKEHLAFKSLHETMLAGTGDEGLLALLAFLAGWSPSNFQTLRDGDDMLDANIAFRLDGERRFLHDRLAAQSLWAARLAAEVGESGLCLVTGRPASVERLHPAIKGVNGAQSSGASLVSFNLDAFTSFDKQQGANAPVSKRAAFAYATVLNHLLRRDAHHSQRLQIGDASTVFWAEASGTDGDEVAMASEDLFAMLTEPPTDAEEAAKIRPILEKIEKGRPLEEIDPNLHRDTRFFVLGLAPNAARLSIRFWHVNTLGSLADRFREHWLDLLIEPRPQQMAPSVWRLLVETAAQRKSDNIPPLLGGEVMRAILTGGRYPRTLLTYVVMRCRADRDLNGMRAAMLKACLARDHRMGIEKEGVSVSLDRSEINPGYRMGRLFAVLESVQRAALGHVNATIRDRYYGAASATPASVFPMLLRTAGHHLSNLRKTEKAGLAGWFEKEIGEILEDVETTLPRNLRLSDQGRFAIGYYHQRYAKRDDAPAEMAAALDTDIPADED
ncbi:MAG: type I-C CRISPR-associated protein Cas8c/Csd1 [Rhodospirillales bacterium]|nr:type I-C CRISPR-associated protein Cas8c/Csd1 [Rhodospirillales bacterium]